MSLQSETGKKLGKNELRRSGLRKSMGFAAGAIAATLGILPGMILSAIAQDRQTGVVLGFEVESDRCILSLADPFGVILSLPTSADICAQTTVGSTIEYESEISQLDTIAPIEEASVAAVVVGDRACYVDLETETGIRRQFATFEACQIEEATTSLVGAIVRPTYETVDIIAFSCAGDIECGRSERATVITSFEVVQTNTRPADPSVTISDLPDGNYRYWSGPATDAVITGDELLATGGVLFLFSKRGNSVTGNFGQIDGESICIQGQANGDTVTGFALQKFPGAQVLSDGETFANFPPDGRLKVRRGRSLPSTDSLNIDGRVVPIDVVRYSSAILDLRNLNRINAGTVEPPEVCQ